MTAFAKGVSMIGLAKNLWFLPRCFLSVIYCHPQATLKSPEETGGDSKSQNDKRNVKVTRKLRPDVDSEAGPGGQMWWW